MRKFVMNSQAGTCFVTGRRMMKSIRHNNTNKEFITIESTLPVMISVDETAPLARKGTKRSSAVTRKQILHISATLEKNRSFCMLKNSYFATLYN